MNVITRIKCKFYYKSEPEDQWSYKRSTDIWLAMAKQFQRRKSVKIMFIYMYKAQGQEQTTSWSPFSPMNIIIPPVYEVYRGYIVFAFSVCVCVCV